MLIRWNEKYTHTSPNGKAVTEAKEHCLCFWLCMFCVLTLLLCLCLPYPHHHFHFAFLLVFIFSHNITFPSHHSYVSFYVPHSSFNTFILIPYVMFPLQPSPLFSFFLFSTTISSTTPLALLLPPSASGDTEKGNCSLCRAHVRSCSSAVFCNRCVRAPALVCDHICHFRLQISGFASPRVTVALYKSAGPTTESLNHWCQIVSEPDWPRAVSY